MTRPPPRSTLFPYTTLFRSVRRRLEPHLGEMELDYVGRPERASPSEGYAGAHEAQQEKIVAAALDDEASRDRKSTRLNSSHSSISYAVFCLKKKKFNRNRDT